VIEGTGAFNIAYGRLTWLSFSTCKTAKVAIADGQTFSDSIDKKSAGNLYLYNFDAILNNGSGFTL
jgi:hypothetical protein